MSKRKKRKKGKNQKTELKLTKFQRKLKTFFGKPYEDKLRELNLIDREICEKYKIDFKPHVLLPSCPTLKNFLKKERVFRLRLLYKGIEKRKSLLYRYFFLTILFFIISSIDMEKECFGENTKLAKKLLIDLFIDLHDSKKSFVEERKREMRNIDEKYINSATEFVTLRGVTIPRDVMGEILSYFRSNYRLLTTLGRTNSTFYLLLLTNWNSVVPITTKSLYKISALILKSMRKFCIGSRFTKNEYEYLVSKITPSRITQINISPNCSSNDIKKFFSFLNVKGVQFSSCSSLKFLRMFEKGADKKRMLEIPSFSIPNLRSIDQFLPNNVSIKSLAKIDELCFGDFFMNDLDDSFDSFYESSYFSIGIYKRNATSSQNNIQVHLPDQLFESGKLIRKVKIRLRFYGCLKNLVIITKQLKEIESLEILDDSESGRRFGFRWLGTIRDDPEKYLFANLTRLKSLVIMSRPSTCLFFKVGRRISSQCRTMKTVKFRNIPLSILSSSLSCFPNLEVFEIEFSSFYALSMNFVKRKVQDNNINSFVDHLFLLPSTRSDRIKKKVSLRIGGTKIFACLEFGRRIEFWNSVVWDGEGAGGYNNVVVEKKWKDLVMYITKRMKENICLFPIPFEVVKTVFCKERFQDFYDYQMKKNMSTCMDIIIENEAGSDIRSVFFKK